MSVFSDYLIDYNNFRIMSRNIISLDTFLYVDAAKASGTITADKLYNDLEEYLQRVAP